MRTSLCIVVEAAEKLLEKERTMGRALLWRKLKDELGSSCEFTRAAALGFIKDNKEELKELKLALDAVDLEGF